MSEAKKVNFVHENVHTHSPSKFSLLHEEAHLKWPDNQLYGHLGCKVLQEGKVFVFTFK